MKTGVPLSNTTKAYIALLAVYIIWGTTFGAIRIGVETLPWALLPMLRFLVAGMLLVGFCLLKGERLPGLNELKTQFIIGALVFFGGNSFVCWAVKHITTGLGGLMVATTPFWMIGLSAILPPREKVTPSAMSGLFIGFIGMVILLSPQLSHMSGTSSLFWLSVLVMLGNTFSWALGSIYARKQETKASLLMSVGLQNVFAGLLLLPVCLYTIPDWSVVHPSPTSLVAIAYLILMGSVLAAPCYLFVLKTLPVPVSSTFAYVTPVLTVIFGWLFLGESITPTIFAGSAVILSGVILVQWVNAQRQAAASSLRTRSSSSSPETLIQGDFDPCPSPAPHEQPCTNQA